jgi:hypothetical protein
MLWVPVPTAVGVYVTWQVEALPLTAESEQLPDELNVPAPPLLQLTVPDGAEALFELASLTVAVQVVDPP